MKNIDDTAQHLVHVAMAWTRAALTLQLMSDVGIFRHVFREMVDTVVTVPVSVQPYDKRHLIFVKYDTIFFDKFELLTSHGSAAA